MLSSLGSHAILMFLFCFVLFSHLKESQHFQQILEIFSYKNKLCGPLLLFRFNFGENDELFYFQIQTKEAETLQDMSE